MSKPFKIDLLLTPQHRAELVALALLPSTTGDALCKWVKDHGYTVARGAVYNWRERVRMGAIFAPPSVSVDVKNLRPETVKAILRAIQEDATLL